MKNKKISNERKKYLNPMITITNEEIDKLKKYFTPKEKNFILMKKEKYMKY